MSDDEQPTYTVEQVSARLQKLAQKGVPLQTDPIQARVMLEYLIETLCPEGALAEAHARYHHTLVVTMDEIERQLTMATVLQGVRQNGRAV